MTIIYKVTFKEIDETFPSEHGVMKCDRETIRKESFELYSEDDYKRLMEQCRDMESHYHSMEG